MSSSSSFLPYKFWRKLKHFADKFCTLLVGISRNNCKTFILTLFTFFTTGIKASEVSKRVTTEHIKSRRIKLLF